MDGHGKRHVRQHGHIKRAAFTAIDAPAPLAKASIFAPNAATNAAIIWTQKSPPISLAG
jgi:hypothetical protein